MRYDADIRRIIITVQELTALARRVGSLYTVCDESEPKYSESAGARFFSDLSHSGIDFRITAPMPAVEGDELRFGFELSESTNRPRKSSLAQARGEAFILAYMLVREGILPVGKSEHVSLSITYFNTFTAQERTVREQVSFAKISAFANKCIVSIFRQASAELERAQVRLPTMKTAKFPYGRMRDGQEEFIRAAYSTMVRGGELFGAAPTGTGKTVSTLYPAIRALGAGTVDKIFYLTPKTTIADSVRECLLHFADNGVKVRAMILSSKERCCDDSLICRKSKRLCARLQENRLYEAVFSLFDEGLAVADLADFKRLGSLYTVCPHELALTYAELCDIVICDFNYVFDPSAHIRRFFDKGGNYGFLIDEAHNLAQRTRQMYSAELGTDYIIMPHTSGILGEFSETAAASASLTKNFYKLLFPYVKDELRVSGSGARHGAHHTRELPHELYTIFDRTLEIAEDELRRNLNSGDCEAEQRVALLRDYIHTLKSFRSAAAGFSEGFELFIFYDESTQAISEGEIMKHENLRAKIFCIDTGAVLREKLKLGRCAVFFSGTLSPIEYFRDTLGGSRASKILEVSSPFVSEQLSVSVIDSVSTRFSERHDTLIPLCKIIGAALAAKPGHYMIFTPSFAYTEAIYKVFRARYPKIRTILQTPNMTARQKQDFLAEFSNGCENYLAAFCVTGGIFSEGIDLPGKKLIGAVIVGIGMPTPSYEREAICAYYDEKLDAGKLYAYVYPGLNKVLQAAGRVIRSEEDRGMILLIDDRFADPLYKECAPDIWRGMKFFSSSKQLNDELADFWRN